MKTKVSLKSQNTMRKLCLILCMGCVPLFAGCIFGKKKAEESQEKTITKRSVVSDEGGDQTYFEGIFVDELPGTGSRFTLCPYYARVPIQRDDSNQELPAAAQLIAAIKKGAPEGQFVFLQPGGDQGQRYPLSKTDFETTADEFEKAIGKKDGLARLFQTALNGLSIIGSSFQKAGLEFQSVIAYENPVQKELIEIKAGLAQQKIDQKTDAILTQNGFDRAMKLADLENRSGKSFAEGASDNQGRNVSAESQRAIFKILLTLYYHTPRQENQINTYCDSNKKVLTNLARLHVGEGHTSGDLKPSGDLK
jgi:hypothetical protein